MGLKQRKSIALARFTGDLELTEDGWLTGCRVCRDLRSLKRADTANNKKWVGDTFKALCLGSKVNYTNRLHHCETRDHVKRNCPNLLKR